VWLGTLYKRNICSGNSITRKLESECIGDTYPAHIAEADPSELKGHVVVESELLCGEQVFSIMLQSVKYELTYRGVYFYIRQLVKSYPALSCFAEHINGPRSAMT
jgi:hypothetical protein